MIRALLLACALLAAGLLPQAADARPRDRSNSQEQREERADAPPARDRGESRPRSEAPRPRGDSAAAARRAQAMNGGGRVLSVDPEGGGYRVKVLKDGEVRTHHVVID